MSKRSKPTFWDAQGTRVLIGLMVLVVVVCVVVVVKLSGLDNKPRWWPTEDAIVGLDHAVRLENTITTQLTAIRQSDATRWSVAMSAEELNGWLKHRLEPTVETHFGDGVWPNELDAVRVTIVGDTLRVGGLVNHDSGSSYIWAQCSLWVEGEELKVSLHTPSIGATRMPMLSVPAVLRDSSDNAFRAYLDLEDGRIARLIAIRVNDGRIELVLETVAKANP